MAESVFNVAEGVRNWGIEYLAICSQAKYPAMTGESHVFFVDGTDGTGDDSAAHNGQFPDAPLLTITAAIGKCTADKHDYIFVLRYPSASYTNEGTKPITMDVATVHLIGGAVAAGIKGCYIKPTTDTAGILMGVDANNCEIAGLDIRAGAAHGCIEIVDLAGLYVRGLEVHDCWFGHEGSAQDGINIDSADAHGLRVWGCVFGDLLTRDGVRIGDAGNAGCTRGLIGVPGKPCNIFRHVGGIAINLAMSDCDLAGIYDNRILLGAQSGGEGITIANGGTKTHVDGNHAAFQDDDPSANPFVDTNATCSWGANYSGKTIKQPGD